MKRPRRRRIIEPRIYHTTCKRCGIPIVSSRRAMESRWGRICSNCITPEEREMIIKEQARYILRKTRNNPGNGLYKEFHGTLPTRTRNVSYEPPNPKQPLIKIGRLSQINYIPEFPSKRIGVEYYHQSGDTGVKKLKSNLILATDLKGKNLYLIRDGKSKYPIVTGRGIIG